MFVCKVCGKEFSKQISLNQHIATSFGKEKSKKHMPLLVYKSLFDGRLDLSKDSLYKNYILEKKTTPEMCADLRVNKKTLLDTMHYYDIHLRNRSEAAIEQIKRGGLWNRGKTKYDHPSIMRYAQGRRGTNNPFYKAEGFEERYKKASERCRKICLNNLGNRQPKTTERRMIKILEARGVQFLRNFAIWSPDKSFYRLYDFLIEGTIIIETHGNYFHANPAFYNADDMVKIGRKLVMAKDIWSYDEQKTTLAQKLGYQMFSLWEYDMVRMTDDEIYEIILNLAKVKNAIF